MSDSLPAGMPERQQPKGVYCTVVAQNYLAQALALYSSVRDVEPDREVVILVIDGDRRDLENGRANLRVETTGILGLTEREVLDLATIYDVVEFATAVKPLFFKALLAEYEQVIYLDPDMFVVAPLDDLETLIDEHGTVLTPHFLEPIPSEVTHITEVHDLTVGVHNLGFCGVGRESIPFLDWWWSHLERECLIYPLLGIFVDQKWTDIGATLFAAHTLQHYGYNVGPHNLHERYFADSPTGLKVSRSGDPLKLMHFSGFDPKDPEAISVRLTHEMRGVGVSSPALTELSEIYAQRVLEARRLLGPTVDYGFQLDATGRRLTKRTRRAFRKALIEGPQSTPLASPFVAEEAAAFRRWTRAAWMSKVGVTAGDAALAVKYVFPDEFSRVKSALPTQFRWIRSRLLSASRVRR